MKIDYSFCLQWVLVTLIGFLVSLCWIEIGGKSDVGVVQGVIGGAAIGVAQALILRRRVKIALMWVLGSIVSWGLIGSSGFGAIGWIAPGSLRVEPRIIFGLFDGLLVGALIGLGQWFALRLEVKLASMWILASTAGWAIGLTVGWNVGGLLRRATHLFLGELVGLALAWVIVAAITGVALTYLLGKTAVEKLAEY